MLSLASVVAGAIVLAQDPAPSQGPEFGEASPIALVIVVLLGLALVVLVRSMSKHLKKVPASFDTPRGGPDASDAGQPVDAVPPAEDSTG